jgi:hypothetical protein
MRDQRFVTAHRGGPLSKEHHRQLITWATDCAEHVLPLFGEPIDDRLLNALEIARAWARGEVPVGNAQKASVASHAAAREAPTPAAVAVARAVGQAVATAHMADRSEVRCMRSGQLKLLESQSNLNEPGRMSVFLLRSASLCFRPGIKRTWTGC